MIQDSQFSAFIVHNRARKRSSGVLPETAEKAICKFLISLLPAFPQGFHASLSAVPFQRHPYGLWENCRLLMIPERPHKAAAHSAW